MFKLIGLALATALTFSAGPTPDPRYGRTLTPIKPCNPVTMPTVLEVAEVEARAKLNANRIYTINVAELRAVEIRVVVFQDPPAGTSFYPCLRPTWLILGK